MIKKNLHIIITILLVFNILWSIIFWGTNFYDKFSNIIYSNPNLGVITTSYNNFFPSFILTIVSFVNLIYIILNKSMFIFNKKDSTKRYAVVYLIISVVSFLIHCISFIIIFSWLVAG